MRLGDNLGRGDNLRRGNLGWGDFWGCWFAENMQAQGLEENKIPAKKGGGIARNARNELESKTGRKVVSGENFLPSKSPSKKLK